MVNGGVIMIPRSGNYLVDMWDDEDEVVREEHTYEPCEDEE